MSELSNMLQGRLQKRQVHIKEQNVKQLDLFASLSERTSGTPPAAGAVPEGPRGKPPEAELILPEPRTPPEVAADVRAALSETGQGRGPETSQPDAEEHPLRTGIYHRPRRFAGPPPAGPTTTPGGRKTMFRQVREWFAGVEMDRRHVSLVVLLVVLVAAIAFWTACPREDKTAPGVVLDLREKTGAAAAPAVAPAPVGPATVAAAPAAAPVAPPPAKSPAPEPAVTAQDWQVPGVVATRNGEILDLRFTAPVFVSADRISVEGMNALKGVAAKLVAMKSGARVVVIGHTDNVPLTSPSPQFQDNADLAAARARVAMEHLAQFARANKALAFEPRPGETGQAPYPNDTPQNRRLNRTVTLQVVPVGN